MNKFLENVAIVLIIAILVTLIVSAIVGLTYGIEKYSCNRLEANTGIETKYAFIGGGCLVKVNDRYIPRENWRGEYQQ